MTVSHRQVAVFLFLAAGFAGFLAHPVGTAPVVAGELNLGAACVKITPPVGIPMAGYYSRRDSEGVLDDIYAKAVVLDDGPTRVAMVACDLIGLPRSIVLEARRLVEEQTGIAADHVMISATHTHTAPVVVGASSRDEAATGGSELSKDYARQLPKWIGRAVAEADRRRAPARVSYGSENETKLSFIRRFWMKDGAVGWNPGVNNPDTIRPIGTIDPQVNVVYAETIGRASSAPAERMAPDGSRPAAKPDKTPLLTYVNFALHLDTTGGVMISADFPATLYRLLADYKGPEMVTIFANGACGNINHINVRWPATQTSPEAAKRLGTILAADVLKVFPDLKQVDDVTLGVRTEVVDLPPATHSDDELRRAREIAAAGGAGTPFLERVKAYRILDVEARRGKPFDVDVQVFTLGREIAWVALPGEVFVELGRSIKAASPFRQTNVVELSNGRPAYIPHRSAFCEGQYEVVSSRYAEGAGEMLVTTAIRLLEELYPDAP